MCVGNILCFTKMITLLFITQKPTSTDVSNLTGAESFFSSDEYLIPVIEDDPLLRMS